MGEARRILRRSVLWLSTGAAAGLLGRGSARGEAAGPVGALSFEAFLARAPELVEPSRARDPAGVDAYLYALASLAVRLGEVPQGKVYPFKPRAPQVSFGPLHRGRPFVVVEWRMEPGARLPPHNHPGYSVCTLGLSGEAQLRHYQPEPGAPPLSSREPFQVRLTREQLIVRGSVSTLGPERDNVHAFVAGPQGARGIDLATLHAGADTGFSFLELKPPRADARTLEARWSGA